VDREVMENRAFGGTAMGLPNAFLKYLIVK